MSAWPSAEEIQANLDAIEDARYLRLVREYGFYNGHDEEWDAAEDWYPPYESGEERSLQRQEDEWLASET